MPSSAVSRNIKRRVPSLSSDMAPLQEHSRSPGSKGTRVPQLRWPRCQVYVSHHLWKPKERRRLLSKAHLPPPAGARLALSFGRQSWDLPGLCTGKPDAPKQEGALGPVPGSWPHRLHSYFTQELGGPEGWARPGLGTVWTWPSARNSVRDVRGQGGMLMGVALNWGIRSCKQPQASVPVSIKAPLFSLGKVSGVQGKLSAGSGRLG